MQVLVFAILGLGSGAIYAMLAQGLVLIYRGSGILNFAQGAVAMVGGYTYYQLSARGNLPMIVALIAAVLMCAALGVLIQLVILRPMRTASALSRVIATLGVLITIQALAYLAYGFNPFQVPSLLPKSTVHIVSSQIIVGIDTIVIFGIGLVLTIGLTLFYKRTSFGRVTTAVAENELVSASLGHSPDMVASINWALGCGIAGLAGALIVPQIDIDPNTLILLIIPAVSAALIGNFSSFPLTFIVALAFGVANSEITRYVTAPGWSTAVPFLAIVAVVVIRGRGLPLRSFVLDRLPTVGTGRIRPFPVLVAYVLGSWLVLSLSSTWNGPITNTLGFGIIGLSVVVVTGYAGQLSLAQAVIAGLGALFAARFVAHMPFVLALLLAAAVAAAIGTAVGLPALRTRGITLAIVTLGLGGALADVVLGNSSYTGGVEGITIPTTTIFGWDIDPILYSGRFSFVTLTILVLLCLGVANLRRGVIGRRLLAVRSNERAAASLGVHVSGSKLYAFTLAAGIAAIGGIMLAFSQSAVEVGQNAPFFTVMSCILIVGATVVGGVGSVGGALIGSLLIADGVVSQIFSGVSTMNEYLPLIGGISLIATLIFAPDGLFETNRRMLAKVLRPVSRLWIFRAVGSPGLPEQEIGAADGSGQSSSIRVPPLLLKVTDLSVTFGGIRAVDGVSLEVRPGEVHGLIGPNGAGKTTLIDAMTGFVRTSAGTVHLGDEDVTGRSARRLAQSGLSRSFQSLELFDDLTVLENLAVACEAGRLHRYLTDMIRPGRVRLTPAATEAVRQFELTDLINRKPGEIPYGRRKTVAIARAVASAPSVLLLDEPAAGLDDREAAELAALIRTLAEQWGIGVLLVEHKIDMIMTTSDRVTVLSNGSVLCSGTPLEVGNDPEVHTVYLGSPPPAEGGQTDLVSVTT